MQDRCSLQRAKDGLLFIVVDRTGIEWGKIPAIFTKILTATILISAPIYAVNLSAIARNE
jgi:hypothetical protein